MVLLLHFFVSLPQQNGTTYGTTWKLRNQDRCDIGDGRFGSRTRQHLAFPLHDGAKRWCGLYHPLSALCGVVGYSGHVVRIHYRTTWSLQCCAGVCKNESIHQHLITQHSSSFFFHRLSWCFHLDDYPRVLCCCGGLVPAISVRIANGARQWRPRICEELLSGVLVESSETYTLGSRLHSHHPSRGDTWCSRWYREGFQPAHAYAFRVIDYNCGCIMHVAWSQQRCGVPVEA